MDAWWTLLLVGLLLTAAGVYFVVSGRRRSSTAPDRAGWREVPGTIVDWVPGRWHPRGGSGPDTRRPFFPRVRYLLPDGSEREFTNPTHLATGFYRTGRTVRVLVDPADPTRAELATAGRDRRLLGCLHAGLGGCLVSMGLLTLAVFVVALVVG